ncbi:PIG-L family deacetylase [Candidatus Woesebacteria bacterium]|nr:PIG-L family deacetylase [Candidatus Woesebacteria bacterium]
MFTYAQIFENKQKMLVVTAHPDDSIVFFGALIHQLVSDKKDVYVLLVTNGARGSRENTVSESELARTRLAEETAALKVLGVSEDNIFCLGHADGEIESNMDLIGEISYYIRSFKVDLVCTHEPSSQYLQTYDKAGYFVQHRDHRKVGEATIDAVYPFSRDRSFFTQHYTEGIAAHSVYDLLLTDEKDCNFDFDCTSLQDVKRQALSEHKSQFDADRVQDVLDSFKFEDKYLEKFHYVHLKW